jgi:hypothetical protein
MPADGFLPVPTSGSALNWLNVWSCSDVAFPRSIKRTCRRFLVRATNHGDRAVRAVEHSVADRTEEQSGDPAAATGTDDEQRGVVGCFDQCHGWTRFDRLLDDGHGRVLLPDLGQRLG